MPDEQSNPGEDSLTLDSELAGLDRLREFIEAFCQRNGISEEVRDHLTIALEELTVNAIVHGNCSPRAGAIRIALRQCADRVQISFSDTGTAFNPLTVPAPRLSEDPGKRPIGGLGIYFVRCLIPHIRYERRDSRNFLFMTKPIERKAEPVRRPGGTDANCDGD